MIFFSNAKINIGLNIVSKRDDGFHNIETIIYPIGLSDVIEINTSEKFELINTGIAVNNKIENNLCYKAYNLLQQKHDLPPVKIHLQKIVPFGAGLGGGSSNASFVLKAANELFGLQLSNEKLKTYASQIGSDCTFFIENKPAIATQKGDILESIDLNLSEYTIVIIYPNIIVNTALAYKNISSKISDISLKESIKLPVNKWKDKIKNDFEKNIFKQYPVIKNIKEKLYKKGAAYASLSGSGSSVYGIFEKYINLKSEFNDFFYWKSKML